MDISHVTGKSSSARDGSVLSLSSQQRKFYKTIFYSVLMILCTYVVFRASGDTRVSHSHVMSKVKSYSMSQFSEPTSVPKLPVKRDDFDMDPIERFDVDGKRPFGFCVIGLVILIFGIVMGV